MGMNANSDENKELDAGTVRQAQPAQGVHSQQKRARRTAIVTGALSIAIGVLYLLMISVLDVRGPLRPPPPEALLGNLLPAEWTSGPGVAAGVPCG